MTRIMTNSNFARRPAKWLTLPMSVHDNVGHNSLEMQLVKRADGVLVMVDEIEIVEPMRPSTPIS